MILKLRSHNLIIHQIMHLSTEARDFHVEVFVSSHIELIGCMSMQGSGEFLINSPNSKLYFKKDHRNYRFKGGYYIPTILNLCKLIQHQLF